MTSPVLASSQSFDRFESFSNLSLDQFESFTDSAVLDGGGPSTSFSRKLSMGDGSVARSLSSGKEEFAHDAVTPAQLDVLEPTQEDAVEASSFLSRSLSFLSEVRNAVFSPTVFKLVAYAVCVLAAAVLCATLSLNVDLQIFNRSLWNSFFPQLPVLNNPQVGAAA